MKFLRLSFLIIVLAAINSCSLLFPPKIMPIQHYILTMPAVAAISNAPSHQTLGINPINAPAWLATTKMVYQLQPDQLNYFAINQWAAPPEQLLQPIIIAALQRANIYRAVIDLPSSHLVDQQLTIQLLQMQQQFWYPNSQYYLAIRAIMTHNHQIAATKYFVVTLPALAATPADGVAAANQAIAQLLPQLIDFCRQHS